MTTGSFTPTEKILLISAPQLIRHALTAADRGGILTQIGEAKALREFLSSHQSKSALVQSIIAGQKDADEKVEASPEQAQRVLEQVGTVLEAKTDEAEGDAVRDFLMSAAEAVAKAVREQGSIAGSGASAAEQKVLAAIATALKATETDKRRRHTAAMDAEAMKRVEEQRAKAKAKAEAEAQKKAEETKTEAQKKAELARQQREESARQHAEQMARGGEEEAQKEREAQQKAEQARRLEEAQKKAELARQQREESARQHAAKVEEGKALSEAEALKQKAEAMKREAEAMERQAEAMKAAAQGAKEVAEMVYVVKPGDTLSGIAKAVYGKAGRWREIFEANRDIINNPNLIRPGWKLRIPR